MIKAILWDFYGVINIDGQLNPDIAQYIKDNKDNYSFGILSASNHDLRPWLKENRIIKYFKIVQTTSELGLSKTSAEFYKVALESIGLQSDEVVFVDDIESYLNTAQSIGINTIKYNYQINIANQLKSLA